jgi:hypothetical protein
LQNQNKKALQAKSPGSSAYLEGGSSEKNQPIPQDNNIKTE